MRCPRCSFEGELIDDACTQCGYRHMDISENAGDPHMPNARSLSTPLNPQSGVSRALSISLHTPSGLLPAPSVPLRTQSGPLRAPSMSLHPQSAYLRAYVSPSRPLSLYTAKSGELLNQGRYRLLDQLILPDNQQGQGAAWLAIDTLTDSTQVVIREMMVPLAEQANKKQLVHAATLRLAETTHAGFPKVLEVFSERESSFIVLQQIEGESLASLLRRQGGALPERTVAEYARQLCEMLTELANQLPPVAHGAISPETVIVSPDRSRVHLIHLPLFPPNEQTANASTAGYKAPEQERGITDPASDLYAVAATMHHAVTGLDPRERIAFFFPPARRLNPAVSQHMETILARELRLSPSQRYTRAADMQRDLSNLLATRSLGAGKKATSAITDPLGLDMLEMRRLSRRRSRRQLGIFGAICLLALCLLTFAYIYPSFTSSPALPAPGQHVDASMTALSRSLDNEWRAEAPLYQTKQIGLSDGRYIFDTSADPSPVALASKKQAAQALLAQNQATAYNNYRAAVRSDPADGEAQIYLENLSIAMQHAPFVTIVLGLALDGSPALLAVSRADLQAAYELQHHVNRANLLPQGLKLRILIGNSGPQDGDAAALAQFIAKRVQIGNLERIIAVVGWPTSEASKAAGVVLGAAQIPLVASSASNISLDNLNHYFFRVNPNAAAEGKAQALFAYNTLKARTILVVRDFTNAYSQSLADAFSGSFQQLGGYVLSGPAYSFSSGKTTVTQYEQQTVQNAFFNHVDLVYLPGSDVDVIRLAQALGDVADQSPWNTYRANLKVLGSNTMDTGLILGDGSGPDAALAQRNPLHMQRILFTAFSDSTEWSSKPQSQQPPFFADWTNLYGGLPNAPVPTNAAIMTNDAFGVLVKASGLVKGPFTGASLRTALTSLGTGNIGPFQGLSGQIAFGSDGDPINKALVLLAVAGNSSSSGKNRLQLVDIQGKLD